MRLFRWPPARDVLLEGAENADRSEQDQAEQGEDACDGEAEDAEGKREQPEERVEQKDGESEGPAEDWRGCRREGASWVGLRSPEGDTAAGGEGFRRGWLARFARPNPRRPLLFGKRPGWIFTGLMCERSHTAL